MSSLFTKDGKYEIWIDKYCSEVWLMDDDIDLKTLNGNRIILPVTTIYEIAKLVEEYVKENLDIVSLMEKHYKEKDETA